MPNAISDIKGGEFVVSSANDHGIGRLRGTSGTEAVIEYFDTPGDSGVVEATVPVESLQRAKLESHSRVYLRDEISGAWTIATLVWHVRPNARVSFPQRGEKILNDSQLYFRWSHPMLDPSPLLENRITESAEFALARRRFLDHMSKQKAAACGMPCLLSSAVDLEHHQIEVVRRVLRDPVQRYLLGDEVGLGKTIEAGFLIRQHVYDNPVTHRVLLIVPKALKQQWIYELRGRFGLGSELDESIKLLDSSLLESLPADFRPTMMLIDEAHQVAALFRGDQVDEQRFEKIRELAISAPGLFLLTATPLLHNERDYLTMLHLLDPQVYALEDLAGFRVRVTQRQAIAEACFTFNSQTPNGFLAVAVEKLRQQLPQDTVVAQWAGILQARLDLDADESDAPRSEAIQRLRTHLNEVYKLHRRLLRNRRIGELRAVTPGRAGANCVVYVDPEARSLFAALDAWREHVLASSGFGLDDAAIDLRKKLFGELLSGCFEGGYGIAQTIPHWLKSPELCLSEEEKSLLDSLVEIAGVALKSTRRHLALAEHIAHKLGNVRRWVVFSSSPESADSVFAILKSKLGPAPIVRHRLGDDSLRRFYRDEAVGVLVCDRSAEEGINMQGRDAAIVHFDLPFLPMRIEQRMGRLDRFSQGSPVRSIALITDGNEWEDAWLEFLRDGLGIFKESIASLQYAALQWQAEGISRSFASGPEAWGDLAKALQGDAGEVARERRMIEEQESLDLMDLSAPAEDVLMGQLLAVEKPEIIQSFEAASRQWAKQALGIKFFEDSLDQPGVFRLNFAEDFTLIPKKTFKFWFNGALDKSYAPPKTALDYRAASRRMSFNRREAQARRCLVARYGERFLDSLFEFTRGHERGKVYAFWRSKSSMPLQAEGSYLRFDFIVETNEVPALSICQTSCDPHAIRREADAMMSPLCVGIWLDSNHMLVSEASLLQLLGTPFRTAAAFGGDGDYDLNEERWRGVETLEPLRDWGPRLRRAREVAYSAIRNLPSIVQHLKQSQELAIESLDRFERQMESRLSVLPEAMAVGERLQFSQEVAWKRALSSALTEPKFILDAVGVVVLDRRPFTR